MFRCESGSSVRLYLTYVLMFVLSTGSAEKCAEKCTHPIIYMPHPIRVSNNGGTLQCPTIIVPLGGPSTAVIPNTTCANYIVTDLIGSPQQSLTLFPPSNRLFTGPYSFQLNATSPIQVFTIPFGGTRLSPNTCLRFTWLVALSEYFSTTDSGPCVPS